jgi:antitoxin (DNA-binding transcriptional repressor) of toxin-antitoxin stability system
VKDAETSLADLIHRVVEGDRVVLEERGESLAALVSLTDLQALQVTENKETLERELPALLNTLKDLREALRAGKQRDVKRLLQDLDDFMATVAVADESTRPWEEFVTELDADVSTPRSK